MTVRVVGCNHESASIAVREKVSFTAEQARAAMGQMRETFADLEVVLLSTCNRTEFYTAANGDQGPSTEQITQLWAKLCKISPSEMDGHLYDHCDDVAVRHLLSVASSLDSMVIGEPQILSQVKEAYQLATEVDATGPTTHAVFQAALKAARRVVGETAIQQRRVSIPSVAVADFAGQIFERFDDKKTLVIGAGEMAEETLRYLADQGAADVTVVNRNPDRATDLAGRWNGRALPWEQLSDALVEADLVISTTGATEPIVTPESFAQVEAVRSQRPLFILDLALPRDFHADIGQRPEVYLYSIDDLREACDRNRARRDKEMPAAKRIVDRETKRVMADLRHRATAPVIKQLRSDWQRIKENELSRLLNKLPELSDRDKAETRQAFDRLVNKLLHPPLESLRDESRDGIPNTLLDALSKLFQLKD